MKKKIILGIFLTLILITVIYTGIAAVKTYHSEIQHHDILVGLGAVIVIIIGGLFVLYESDLFCTVWYFLVKPKTKLKSLFHILSHLSLILTLVFSYLVEAFMELRKFETAPLIPFLIWIVFRILSFLPSKEKNQNP